MKRFNISDRIRILLEIINNKNLNSFDLVKNIVMYKIYIVDPNWLGHYNCEDSS